MHKREILNMPSQFCDRALYYRFPMADSKGPPSPTLHLTHLPTDYPSNRTVPSSLRVTQTAESRDSAQGLPALFPN